MKNMICCILLLSVAFGCKRDTPNSKSVHESQDQDAQQGKNAAEGNKPQRTEVDAPAPGKPFTNSIGMKLVYIPPGEFMMGSRDSVAEVIRKGGPNPKFFTSEHPQHRVKITSGFYMSSTETTQSQYEEIMNNNPSYFKGSNNPVETVSWDDAVEFCRRLSEMEVKKYRLPTEAEWEYACRAGTTTPFYTGETISTDQANYNGNTVYGNGTSGIFRRETMPVCSFSLNNFGLYDMHSGNVWEWCQDWYGENYYAASPVSNPQAPSSGTYRVIRGSSWSGNAYNCRVAWRGYRRPGHPVNSIGFRIALDMN